MRFFMIDRIVEFKKGDYARGIKNITLTDEILHDHFPEYPVYPGTFIVEGMAQLGGFLLEMTYNSKKKIRRAVLVKIESAKFHKPAEPGDTLILEARILQQYEKGMRVKISAFIHSEKVAAAQLTYLMKDIDYPKIHEQRKYIYRLWTKHIINFPKIL